MVELVLALPFLLVFVFAIAEYTVLLIRAQHVTSMSREAAGAVYRDCMAYSGDQLNACLAGITGQITQGASRNLLPGLDKNGKVIVSLYGVTVPGGPVVLKGTSQAGDGAYGSRFSALSIDPDVVSDLGDVAVGEVFYPPERLTPLTGWLHWDNFPEVLYETTVF